MLKYLTIPLFQEQLDRLQSTPLTLKEKYDIQAKFYLIAIDLLQQNIRKEKIHSEYCPYLQDEGIYIGENSYPFEFPDEQTELIQDKTNEIADVLISKGQEWLNEIIENLKKEEKSDEEIITGII